MLETLRALNKMPIYSIHDAAFASYGRVVTDIDVSALAAACHPEMPAEGVCYQTFLPELEACAGFDAMQAYFGSPMQAGCCWGHNTAMDALEYHRASEFNIAVTDVVLFLADRRDIQPGDILDSACVKAFYVPKGACIEVYATTLHYAPCEVTKDGFYCIVLLPRGTNEALPGARAQQSEQRLMTARDKWLLCCKECGALVRDGVHPGIVGGNIFLTIQ